jgi:predicted nucleotidyltransferase
MPRISEHIHMEIPQGQIEEFCRRHRIHELALFGSVLREDFRPDSDVDVLVEFEPEVHHGLFALVRMQSELEEILGRRVDVIEKLAIEKSRNYIRRKTILSSVETIYASR